jgi:cytochrome c-type biogenesis protein CcmE
MSKGLQIAVCALSVFVGLVWWLSAGGVAEGTFEYYSSVSDFHGADTARERLFRVHGFVVPGSIAKDLPAGHVDFAIQDDSGAMLEVRYLGIDIPDLFGDGAEVVVEGRSEGPQFLADRVLAKCPSKYEVAPTAPGPDGAPPRNPAPQA